MSTNPPPLPAEITREKKGARGIWIYFGLIACALVSIVAGLICFGVFSGSSGSMAPAIEPGDHVLVARLVYAVRRPKRGEIALFRTDKIPAFNSRKAEIYAKRVAGLPGERVSIANGTLLINGEPATLRNKNGDIRYTGSPIMIGGGFDGHGPLGEGDEITVPPDSYFVLGDNTGNSYDSRMFGFVPAASLRGRALRCVAPAKNAGPLQ